MQYEIDQARPQAERTFLQEPVIINDGTKQFLLILLGTQEALESRMEYGKNAVCPSDGTHNFSSISAKLVASRVVDEFYRGIGPIFAIVLTESGESIGQMHDGIAAAVRERVLDGMYLINPAMIDKALAEIGAYMCAYPPITCYGCYLA